MFTYLKKFILWLRRLTDQDELEIHKFFFNKTFFKTKTNTASDALRLMNLNYFKLCISIERYYHGYKQYNRSFRKELYENLKNLEIEFNEFSKTNSVDIISEITKFGLRFNDDELKRLKYIKLISQFFRNRENFKYKESVNLSQSLIPKDDVFYFDCNQICNLYIHLYSLEFDAADLRVKLPKDHVCLHFKGIDIEATNGEFLIYNEVQETYPITEMISVNMLDVSDLEFEQFKIKPRKFYKLINLAKFLSNNPVIENNIQVSYQKMALFYLDKTNTKSAEFFIKKISNLELAKKMYYNLTVKLISLKEFGKAKYYIKKFHFDNLMLQIYSFEYDKLYKKIKNIKTLKEASKHKPTYKKMLKIAFKMKDDKLIASLKDTLKNL